MEDEGVLFEGLRVGSTQAFEDLLAAEDAGMRRLARLYVPEEHVAPLVRQAWSVALPGLDMFTWHTTLRAWLTGILVTYGRAWHLSPARTGGTPPPSAAVTVVAPRGQGHAGGTGTTGTPVLAADPLPWSSLAWSPAWTPGSWEALERALASRPLPEQEVLWLHDVEGWPWREVLDTLGLVADEGAALLHGGREALAVAVAEHLGAADGGAGDEEQRSAGVAGLLAALRPRRSDPVPDAGLVRGFVAWRRQRGVRAWRRWRWELVRRRTSAVRA